MQNFLTEGESNNDCIPVNGYFSGFILINSIFEAIMDATRYILLLSSDITSLTIIQYMMISLIKNIYIIVLHLYITT